VDKEMSIITQNGFNTKVIISGRNSWNTEVNKLAHIFGFDVSHINITATCTEKMLRHHEENESIIFRI
jgi:hypothetical protein